MVEKMKYINITGPKHDIDRIVDIYLDKYEIHLENALAELGTDQAVRPFFELNSYKEVLSMSTFLVDRISAKTFPADDIMTGEEAIRAIKRAYSKVETLSDKRLALMEEEKQLSLLQDQLQPFRVFDFDLEKIQQFQFIHTGFGRITPEYYNRFTRYVYDNLNSVFYECERTKDYIWGVYFAPVTSSEQVDAIYSSLHFEHITLSADYKGTPEEVYQELKIKRNSIRKKADAIKEKISETLNLQAPEILLADLTLRRLSENFDIRKLAACTQETANHNSFYILCGWMGKADAKAFVKEVSNDPNIYCILENDTEPTTSTPPTKLKNPKILKPFEMFIKMYGLPAYNEMDPTIFVALTYTFIFGVMFGDVGQGLCLAIGGFLLYRFKKMDLAAIVSIAGIWSTAFGFMYGSLFGFEEILHAVWRRPMDNITSTLITAVVFGVGLILIAMVLNIINAIRARDWERLLFDPSGIAGLIIYGGVAGCVGLYFLGHPLPATIVLAILLGLPLLCVFLREPLGNLVEKKDHIFPPGSKAMFFVEAFVELFDVVLSYATNTISFVRVGAFALSHAGMMGVVLSLAGATHHGGGNPLVIIIGNIVVMGLEGLVVGIQVLRLEYYEMFSRFYRGSGREFRPFRAKQN